MSDACCSAGECARAAYKDGLCGGHYKRRQRGQPLTPLRQAMGGALGAKDHRDRLKDACFAYENAIEGEDEAGIDRAWNNLVDAAEWVAMGVPKTPRLQKLGYRLLAELRATMRSALKGNEPPSAMHGDAHRVPR